MIDQRTDGGAVIQELAVPGPLKRLLEEVSSTASILHQLEFPDNSVHMPDSAGIDPFAVDVATIRRSSILAVMGDDGAHGALELVGDDTETHGDGAIRVRWPASR